MKDNECPECGGYLKPRKGGFGDFFGCSNYPHCTYTTKARLGKKTTYNEFRDKNVLPGNYGDKQ